jgi:hypothetical protein
MCPSHGTGAAQCQKKHAVLMGNLSEEENVDTSRQQLAGKLSQIILDILRPSFKSFACESRNSCNTVRAVVIIACHCAKCTSSAQMAQSDSHLAQAHYRHTLPGTPVVQVQF